MPIAAPKIKSTDYCSSQETLQMQKKKKAIITTLWTWSWEVDRLPYLLVVLFLLLSLFQLDQQLVETHGSIPSCRPLKLSNIQCITVIIIIRMLSHHHCHCRFSLDWKQLPFWHQSWLHNNLRMGFSLFCPFYTFLFSCLFFFFKSFRLDFLQPFSTTCICRKVPQTTKYPFTKDSGWWVGAFGVVEVIG